MGAGSVRKGNKSDQIDPGGILVLYAGGVASAIVVVEDQFCEENCWAMGKEPGPGDPAESGFKGEDVSESWLSSEDLLGAVLSLDAICLGPNRTVNAGPMLLIGFLVSK